MLCLFLGIHTVSILLGLPFRSEGVRMMEATLAETMLADLRARGCTGILVQVHGLLHKL